MENQKDEQEIADTEEALRFIGKKYLYVYECNGEVKFFDTYSNFKRHVNPNNAISEAEMHDFIVQFKKCRLVVEREFAYEPAMFSLDTNSAKYKKIVEGNITDYILIK